MITNAGDPTHWAWKRRETARTSRHWRFCSVPGPLPWLTAADLEILQENAETDREYERLHLNRWIDQRGPARYPGGSRGVHDAAGAAAAAGRA